MGSWICFLAEAFFRIQVLCASRRALKQISTQLSNVLLMRSTSAGGVSDGMKLWPYGQTCQPHLIDMMIVGFLLRFPPNGMRQANLGCQARDAPAKSSGQVRVSNCIAYDLAHEL